MSSAVAKRLWDIVHWVLTLWATRGWLSLVAEVKGISLYARSCSLGSSGVRSYRRLLVRLGFPLHRHVLAQVATLGRALPPALDGQVRNTLAEHRSSLECPEGAPQTDPDILHQIAGFGRWFARKYKPSEPLARPWLMPRSCLEASRSQGGQLGALAKWEAEFDAVGVSDESLRRKPLDSVWYHTCNTCRPRSTRDGCSSG